METEITDIIKGIVALYGIYILFGVMAYSILSQKWIFSNSKDRQSSRCMRRVDKLMSKMHYGNISIGYDFIFICITYPIVLCELLYLYIKDKIS